jgi:hypothetical protein
VNDEMPDDKYDTLGPILSEIGGEGAAIVGGNPDGVYIYAEMDGGSVYAAVFKEDDEVVRYFDPTHELFQLIRETWETENADEAKRWAVMEYEVQGTKFDVQFKYPEELDPKDYSTDRRRAALKTRYGDKPVVYPPMPGQ